MLLDRSTALFLLALLVLVGASIATAYYRYIVLQDVHFYISEDEIPDRFNADSYQTL